MAEFIIGTKINTPSVKKNYMHKLICINILDLVNKHLHEIIVRSLYCFSLLRNMKNHHIHFRRKYYGLFEFQNILKYFLFVFIHFKKYNSISVILFKAAVENRRSSDDLSAPICSGIYK